MVKKCSLKIIFLNKTRTIKIRMIFYSDNWLWKLDLGTFWWPVWKSNRKNLELAVDPCLQNSTTEVTLSKHYLFCLINIMKNFLNVVLFMEFFLSTSAWAQTSAHHTSFNRHWAHINAKVYPKIRCYFQHAKWRLYDTVRTPL